MRKKIACVGIRFSVTTVVTTIVMTVATTVVTPVVTENRMPTHAIFILMLDARCWTLFLRKNCPPWTMTPQRTTQRSPAQKSKEPSNDKHTFSRVCHRHHDSWNVSGMHRVLSRRRNPSKYCISWDAGAQSDDSSREMQL